MWFRRLGSPLRYFVGAASQAVFLAVGKWGLVIVARKAKIKENNV